MDRRASSLDRRVDELVRRCRDAGMNVTPQRLAVYRALLESADHPSPEQLYQRVRVAMPSLSLATIYKALDALQELGLVVEVSPMGEHKRYDANDERHHHLVCTQCHKVSDFYDERFDALAPPPRLGGFRVQTLTVQLKGLCSDCAAPPPEKARKKQPRGST
jgi:Fur family transcriptional regulator, peroxide stress response regulator